MSLDTARCSSTSTCVLKHLMWTTALVVLALSGCGGGSGGSTGSGGGGGGGGGGNTTYTIGGTITGASGTVVLQNNGGNNLSSGNGNFTFSTAVASGAAYTVTVLTPPTGQTCTVTNQAGNASANVTNVAVACTTKQLSIGGTVSGLSNGATVVLDNNGGDSLRVSASGGFTFQTKVAYGAAYDVSVFAHPSGQTCTVTNGTAGAGGATADVTNVAVACTTNGITVSGTLAGLTGTVVLQNNLGDNLAVAAPATAFAFPGALANNGAYAVTVFAQPTGQTCTVANGSGTAAASVTNVTITCANNNPTITVSGTLAGLAAGQSVILRLGYFQNGAQSQDLTVSANGIFTFGTPIPSGAFFSVVVLAPPATQRCTAQFNNGLSSTDANFTKVSCENTTTTYTAGGSVTGLDAGKSVFLLIEKNNSVLAVTGNTTFQFPNGFTPGTGVDVEIVQQPSGQTCILTNGNLTMNANVTNVLVTCIDNTTAPLSGTFRLSDAADFITLFPDGTYVTATLDNDTACGANKGNGVELGVYSYDQTTGAFSIKSNLIDSNGGCGVWDSGSGAIGTLQQTGHGQAAVLTFAPADNSKTLTLVPVAAVANTLVGSYRVPLTDNILIIGPDGHYLVADLDSGTPGVEYGCYTQTGTTDGNITPDISSTCKGVIKTDGNGGITGGPISYHIVDAYSFVGGDGSLIFRILPN